MDMQRTRAPARRNPEGGRSAMRRRNAGEGAGTGWAMAAAAIPNPSNIAASLFGIASMLALAACGGGGGGGNNPSGPTGGGGSGNNPPGPAAWSGTAEYRASNGLRLMRAAEGYALRTTGGPGGEGVTVAVLDTKIDRGHPDLDVARSFAFDSQYDTRPGDHGTHVAGTIAARRNGRGVHGVAYNATLVGLAVLDPDGYPIDRFPYLPTPNTDIASAIASAAGLDRAYTDRSPYTGRPIGSKVSNPAASSQIMNMSLGSPDPYGDIRSAMQDAAGAGRIMVAALGNDAIAGPSGAPASYVASSGIAGWGIAVGALDETGKRPASFSNTCGRVANYCLFAPGESINSTVAGGGYDRASGTSMAAPQVAGAAAVLWAAFPNKSGDRIVQRLLTTADDDLARDGVDSRYGHGRLNLEAAMNPVGLLSVPLAGGGNAQLAGSALRLPAGFRLSAGPALADAVAYDEEEFPFLLDLASLFQNPDGSGPDGALREFVASLGSAPPPVVPVGPGTTLLLASGADAAGPGGYPARGYRGGGTVRDFGIRFQPDPALSLVFEYGFGEAGPAAGFDPARARRDFVRDRLSTAPFAALAGEGIGLGLSWRPDGNTEFDFSSRAGNGRFGSGRARLASAGLARRIGAGSVLDARLGALTETGSVLGIRGDGAVGGFSQAGTRFVDLGVSSRVSDGLLLFASASRGVTDAGTARRDSLVSGWSGMRAESYAVGSRWLGLWGADRLTLTAAMPFRARRAALRMTVPAGETADGVVSHVSETVDLAPSGRETRLRFAYEIESGAVSLAVGGYARLEPGHDEAARPEYGLGARARLRF